MGFTKPSAPAVETKPPVVAEVVEQDAQKDYDQKSSRRKGLLSTILSTQKNRGGAMNAAASHSGNTTLG